MDKALFRAYVKELVKEQIEDSVEKAVKKILPELLAEAVAEVKATSPSRLSENTAAARPKPSRAQLAAMMGLERHGDTIVATSTSLTTPEGTPVDISKPQVQQTIDAINKDYSQMMKHLKLT